MDVLRRKYLKINVNTVHLTTNLDRTKMEHGWNKFKAEFFFSFNSFHLMRLYNVTFLKDIFLCAFLFLCCLYLSLIFVLSRLVLRRRVSLNKKINEKKHITFINLFLFKM
jgi:hypothetical protein